MYRTASAQSKRSKHSYWRSRGVELLQGSGSASVVQEGDGFGFQAEV